MADCSNLSNTTNVTLTTGTFPVDFCHSTMATTYAQFFDDDITTAAAVGTTFVTTDDTPDSGDQDKIWLKQGEPADNCMPKGWYIYDSNMSTSDKWRNFMSTPAGSMTMFGGAAAPEGWLLCDGTAYSTTTYPEYEDLYAAIANLYGGSDATDFKVPDLGGRVPVGLAASGTFDALNNTGGAETHALTETEVGPHSHDIATRSMGNNSDKYHGTSPSGSRETGVNQVGTYTGSEGVQSSGDGTAHENMPPYVVVNYLIKY